MKLTTLQRQASRRPAFEWDKLALLVLTRLTLFRPQASTLVVIGFYLYADALSDSITREQLRVMVEQDWMTSRLQLIEAGTVCYACG